MDFRCLEILVKNLVSSIALDNQRNPQPQSKETDTTQIIRATNRIAVFFIGLLIYWIFIFISIQVFDFKVFRENITQSFFFSIIGIFAVLGEAVVVNIMFNLTKIADHIGKTETTPPKNIRTSNWRWGLFIASFPLLFGLLYH